MKGFYAIVMLLVCAIFADSAQAGVFSWLGFRGRARACYSGSCQTGAVQKSAVQKSDAVQKSTAVQKTEAVQKSGGSSMSALAMRKAQWQANRGRVGHPGWGFGGARAEGAGFSTRSADSALRNCCYYGQRRIAASAVVRGSRGWYATILYW